MWWFAALHANLLLLRRRTGRPRRAAGLLDAGCGTGGLLARIARAVSGADSRSASMPTAAPARAPHAKSARPVCAGSVNALPFADGGFGAIFSADVLCHGGVDERAALAQFHRVLARPTAC